MFSHVSIYVRTLLLSARVCHRLALPRGISLYVIFICELSLSLKPFFSASLVALWHARRLASRHADSRVCPAASHRSCFPSLRITKLFEYNNMYSPQLPLSSFDRILFIFFYFVTIHIAYTKNCLNRDKRGITSGQ